MFIPEEKITEIKNQADIVDIVSEAVLLKQSGRNHLGLCPFHSEKTPSFTVSPDKQIFYCFGCGAGGNIFSFLMKLDGLSFPEAVKRLAKRYGIEIPSEARSPADKRRMSERENLLAINRRAMDFFSRNLLKNDAGKAARGYLKTRKITQETAKRFCLGFAPGGWDHLSRFFLAKKISLSLAEKVGLVVQRKSKSGFYDRFRDRIIFPIHDLGVQVIGFGGRVMDDAMPKYLNSPESPVYIKSKSLYGLHLAKQRCRETDTVYIVEGYFDLIRLHQYDIQNAVATLGTALTESHIRTLKGYARRVVLVFDSDDAGMRAVHRSIGLFMKEEMDARVMVLPSGYDPDAFLVEFGYHEFLRFAETAAGMMQFLMVSAIEKYGLSIDGKIGILKEMQQPLASIHDDVARSLYAKELAERIGVDEAVIVEKVRASMGRKAGIQPRGSAAADTHGRDAVQGRGFRLERQIVAMMLQFPEIVSDIDHRSLIDRFEDKTLQSIGRRILQHQHKPVDEIIHLMDDGAAHSIAAGLAMEDVMWDRDGCLKLISQFERGRDRRENDLLEKIKSAEDCKDHELVLELLRKRQMQVNQSQ